MFPSLVSWLPGGQLIWVVLVVLYMLVLIGTTYRIIMDTENSGKALAYLLLLYMLPVVGLVLYRAVGKNYRKHKLYDKRIFTDTIRRDVIEPLLSQYHDGIISRHEELIHSHYGSVIDLLTYGGESFLTDQNDVTLLINGEQKYPALLQALREAKDTIHMLYYIFDDDEVGREIANILMEKAREGVSVRFVFDDFGSKGIHKHLVQQMQDAGVELYPFFPLKWWSYLSRINNRNHRKIVIVDGLVGFVGGINISNHYDNRHEDTNHMYRRDTHLRIVGPAVWQLQAMFVSDWHFASGEPLDPSPHFFPSLDAFSSPSLDTAVQIVGSGPDSSYPSLLHGLLASINTAQEQILITTPYFVPTADFITALVLASHRGVDVKVLLPHKGDSVLLDVANQAYVADLLDADIEVYFYNKGFVHAKTCVIDRMIGIVGTANLDMRSFDLNFEVNAMLYGAPMAQELTDIYLADLADSIRVDRDTWSQRPWWKHFLQQIVRLLAPLL